MSAGTIVIAGGILAGVILLCIVAVLCYCRLQVLSPPLISRTRFLGDGPRHSDSCGFKIREPLLAANSVFEPQ